MDFTASVSAFIDSAKQKAAGGLTLKETGDIFVEFIHLAVAIANELSNPGTDKKVLVMAGVAALYDAIAPAIPLPMFIQPFRPLLRQPIKNIVLALADGVVEAVYRQLKDAQ